MTTARSTWKAVERRAAAFWGSVRNRGSGSSGRADESSSDSKHPNLYIETKLRANPAVWNLWADCKDKCKGADKGKTPVVMLARKGHSGFLVIFHTSDIEAIINEYRNAAKEEEEAT